MTYYRFEIFNFGHELINCFVREYRDEPAAIAAADYLLASSRQAAVEVWTGTRRIYRRTQHAPSNVDNSRDAQLMERAGFPKTLHMDPLQVDISSGSDNGLLRETE